MRFLSQQRRFQPHLDPISTGIGCSKRPSGGESGHTYASHFPASADTPLAYAAYTTSSLDIARRSFGCGFPARTRGVDLSAPGASPLCCPCVIEFCVYYESQRRGHKRSLELRHQQVAHHHRAQYACARSHVDYQAISQCSVGSDCIQQGAHEPVRRQTKHHPAEPTNLRSISAFLRP